MYAEILFQIAQDMAIYQISLSHITQYIQFIGSESSIVDPLVRRDVFFKDQLAKLIAHFDEMLGKSSAASAQQRLAESRSSAHSFQDASQPRSLIPPNGQQAQDLL